MSGFDSTVFNTRERPVSSDHNDLQSLIHRNVLDVLKYMLSSTEPTSDQSSPNNAIRDVVLEGLQVEPNGSNINVLAGALLQNSSTLVPVPGALDNSYRLGVVRVTQAVTAPAPGANTWYLVQAKMVEVVTVTESRDVLNATSGNFEPQLVDKRQERSLTFTFKAGTSTQVPAADTDFVPIAGVFRPAGGGAVLNSHIVDLRPLWKQNVIIESALTGSSRPTKTQYRTNLFPGLTPFNFNVTFDVEAIVNGRRLFAQGTDIDLSLAPFLDSSANPATTRGWYYVYLCAPRGLTPRARYNNVRHSGLLVTSRVAPAENGTNSAVITLAEPFGSLTVPVGEAVCVMYLAGVNTTLWQRCISTRLGHVDLVDTSSGNAFTIVVATATIATVNLNAGFPTSGSEIVPFGVDARVRSAVQTADAASVATRVAFIDTATSNQVAREMEVDLRDATGGAFSSEVILPSRVFRSIDVDILGTPGTATAKVHLVGFDF